MGEPLNVILCAHTPSYSDLVARFFGSLISAPDNVARRALPYEDSGDWLRNTVQRPVAVFDFITQESEACFRWDPWERYWLMDADLVYSGGDLGQLFGLLDTADVAVCLRNNRAVADKRVSAGIVGFKGRYGLAFLSIWAQNCANRLHPMGHWNPDSLMEQEELLRAWSTISGPATANIIGRHIHAVPEDAEYATALFRHDPASRTRRK